MTIEINPLDNTSCNSTVTEPVLCARIAVEVGSHVMKILFNHIILNKTKGLEKSFVRFRCENAVRSTALSYSGPHCVCRASTLVAWRTGHRVTMVQAMVSTPRERQRAH